MMCTTFLGVAAYVMALAASVTVLLIVALGKSGACPV